MPDNIDKKVIPLRSAAKPKKASPPTAEEPHFPMLINVPDGCVPMDLVGRLVVTDTDSHYVTLCSAKGVDGWILSPTEAECLAMELITQATRAATWAAAEAATRAATWAAVDELMSAMEWR